VSVEMVIMDALRTPDADEMALGETAALMLEDNPTPTMNIPAQEVREREPVEQGAGQETEGRETEGQDGGPESLQTDFDSLPATREGVTLGERIAAAMHAAKTRDVLDIAADEIRELARPEQRAAVR
jgi:hypothetical protein